MVEPTRLWGNTPKVFAALAVPYGALDRPMPPLERALKSRLTVGVFRINRCAFCRRTNSATVLKRSIGEKKLAFNTAATIKGAEHVMATMPLRRGRLAIGNHMITGRRSR